jgi:hypothetical protein
MVNNAFKDSPGRAMARIRPSQVLQTTDDLFPHAAKNARDAPLSAGHSSQLLGILNLLKNVPDELIILTSADYSELVLAESTIEERPAHRRARGNVGDRAHVKGVDAVTVIRRALAKCPDEYPPSATTELLFISDAALRENIRRDLGASNRALNNAEWKAATVLAGAATEALLHWRLQEPSPGPTAIASALTALVAAGAISKAAISSNIDRWELNHFIEVAGHPKLLKPDTCSAERLARSFRNLIHPGRAARLAQTCDRATAYSAIGALKHVIRDLT